MPFLLPAIARDQWIETSATNPQGDGVRDVRLLLETPDTSFSVGTIPTTDVRCTPSRIGLLYAGTPRKR